MTSRLAIHALSLAIALSVTGCTTTPTGVTRAGADHERISDANSAVIYAEWLNAEGGNTVINRIDGVGVCAWAPCHPVFRVTAGDHKFYVIYGARMKVGDTEVSVKNMLPGHVYQLIARSDGPNTFKVDVLDRGSGVKEVDTRDRRYGSPIVKVSF